MQRLLAWLCLSMLIASAPCLRGEDEPPLPTPPATPDGAETGEPATTPPAPAPPLPPIPTPPVIPEKVLPEPPAPKVWDARTVRLTGGVIVGVPAVGYLLWWRKQTQFPFHFTNERWFQEDAYAGGADKASHLTASFMATDALRASYKNIGKSDIESRMLSIGVVTFAGAIVEAGDGISHYGFSWEDLASDFIGALVSDQIHHLGLRDTVGLRFGLVKALQPDPCCTFRDGYGDDYSTEVFMVDLKLAGLLPRMGVKPGPAKFFLLSATYGTKGYRHSLPEFRERNVGIDLGLNLPEILRALGVKEDRWWGKALLAGLTYVRLPYTAFGWHYDLNHKRWNGPDTSDQWFPGP